jgi:exopolyphosphatase / guanosine-5'-triphosphate,3'-diphosphate pyrophosphatase
MQTLPLDTLNRAAPDHPPGTAATPVAVIDIGTSSIRMAIAEISPAGEIRTIEKLAQAVALGKDTFTTGQIQKSTIEDCARVLRSYRRLLAEYHIDRPEQIRVVATSAVREAANRLAFIDRIYIATGLEVEPLDEAEVSRVTYLGIQPYLKEVPELARAMTIVVEVGGGSTELLVLEGENVAYSHTYRLGSLRLRETLHAHRAPAVKVRTIMESQIERTIEQLMHHVPRDERPVELIALGGDVRFAAWQLVPEWDREGLARLSLAALEKLADRMLALTPDALVRKYHLTFPDAETLGPALLTYVHLARAFELKHLLVTNVNLRDGLLKEMAVREAWTEEFKDQIIRSAVDLGRKFQFDEPHALHVARLSRTLFQALQGEHQLPPRYELILYVAAVLHEIGLFVSTSSHHKHSMYVILNSELFGLTKKDVRLVALVARYHRRASPKPTHSIYNTLDREARVAVAKLAAILRVADALERSHSQRIDEIHCTREEGRLVISTPRVEDLSLEQLALKQKGPLFEETFGMKVLLRRARR